MPTRTSHSRRSIPLLSLLIATALPSGVALADRQSSHRADEGDSRKDVLVVHGSWQNPLPCAPTSAQPDLTARDVDISGCLGTSTWTGTLSGVTTSTQAGVIQSDGSVNGTADETFTGTDLDDTEATDRPAPSSLRTLYRFSVDSNGVFRAVGRIVGGTGAWAGRDGCSLFVGTFVGGSLGSGGYTIDWNLHPTPSQLREDATTKVSAAHDPCTLTTY